MFDLIIKNGKLVDGTGSAWFYGDVAIQGQRIVEVGRLSSQSAKRVIDAMKLYYSIVRRKARFFRV